MILNPDSTSFAFRQRRDIVGLVILPHLSISKVHSHVSFASLVPPLLSIVQKSLVFKRILIVCLFRPMNPEAPPLDPFLVRTLAFRFEPRRQVGHATSESFLN
jgi:hypothetical protein